MDRTEEVKHWRRETIKLLKRWKEALEQLLDVVDVEAQDILEKLMCELDAAIAKLSYVLEDVRSKDGVTEFTHEVLD